jgi:hypothetical protein
VLKAAAESGVRILVESTTEHGEANVLVHTPRRVRTAWISLALPMLLVYEHLHWQTRGATVGSEGPVSEEQVKEALELAAHLRANAAHIAASVNDDKLVEHRHVLVALNATIQLVTQELARRRRTQRQQKQDRT